MNNTIETIKLLIAELAAPVIKLEVSNVFGNMWSERDADPGDVAERLSMLGCKGTRYNNQDCPVVHYLRHHGITGVTIGTSAICGFERCRLPKAIVNFTSAFDRGAYPNLLRLD